MWGVGGNGLFLRILTLERKEEEEGEIGNLLPNNRRQRRTCYALCHILYPVSAAHTSIFQMDSNSTSYKEEREEGETCDSAMAAAVSQRSCATAVASCVLRLVTKIVNTNPRYTPSKKLVICFTKSRYEPPKKKLNPEP